MKPRAWVSWSSGKDSAWALHAARAEGRLEVAGLFTTISQPYGRVSVHGVREEVLRAQAAAAGLPLVRLPFPSPCPDEVYQEALDRVGAEARRQGVTRMVFGDLSHEDARQHHQHQFAGAGIEAVFPLWKRPTRELAEEMIAGGLAAYVTCLDPRRVPRELAGRRFDRELLAALPAGVDPCAENGEFHTCVVAGPMFDRPIAVEVGQTVDHDGFVFTDLMMARQSC